MKHTGTISFETHRLIFRRFAVDDWRDMLENWASDPAVQSGYGEPAYEDEPAAKGLLEKYIGDYKRPDTYRWAITEKVSGRNIGQIAFCRVYDEAKTAEIEYCVGRAFQGRGYATEALEGLIRYAFSVTDFEKLEAYHRIENIASGRVLEKSSMRPAPSVTRFGCDPGAAAGKGCYCITKRPDR